MNPVNNNLTFKALEGLNYKTPFLIIDLEDIKQKYQKLQTNLPSFKVFYAVKCNPEQKILQTLKREGSAFEIASIGELKRLTKIGVDPAGVSYSNPVKPIEQIEEAYQLGVSYFAFDNPEELEKIARVAPGSKVYLRLSVSNHGSLINLADKFGANKSDAVKLLTYAASLGLEAWGLTFHVGSQSETTHLWDQAFDDATEILEKLHKRGVKLGCLNIGGGFPVRYTDEVPSIEKIGKTITNNIEKLPYPMQLWCEPGRYLVGEAGVIAATIIGRTTRHNKPWIYVDVGRFQAFIELFESDSLRYPVFTSRDDSTEARDFLSYTVTGPSCDSHDTIARNVSLPANLQIGDKIYFATAGAYTHVYGAPFNDFPVPEVKYLPSQKTGPKNPKRQVRP